MIILIDQREKLPYCFTGYPVEVKRAHLKTGDYSLEGHSGKITVERKSKEDLYMSLGRERDRFEAEFQRLREFEYTALVIESSLSGLLIPPFRSRMNPKSIIQSLISWSIRYGVHVFFSDNRTYSECLIYSLFEKYLYNLEKKKVA
jgi:ERCC4-type nuclease